MAKKKAVAAVPDKVPHMTFQLSPDRDKELRTKLKEASDYYELAFGVRLSAEDIHGILSQHIEAEKRRVFLKKVGNVSEADILWFAQEFLNGEAEESSVETAGSGDEDGGDLAA